MSVGHNGIVVDQLRAFVERAERLHEERSSLGQDLAELFKEARGSGFDVKTIKKVVSLRKKDRAERQKEAAILDLYLSALGEA